MKSVSTQNVPRSPARKPRALKRRQARTKQSRNAWLYAAGLILLAACLLRLILLDLKPLHHDEGVNGNFMMQLFRSGHYQYDPVNYHGPSLYYAGLVTTTVNALFYGKAGLSTFAVRLVPALSGVGLSWLVFLLRRYIGSFATLAAGALLAVSPAMVYFSRYFIHEIPFVFLTLGLVICVLRYHETAQSRFLMFASACAALMFATKETCVITFAVLTAAWFCVRLYFSLRDRLSTSAIGLRAPIKEVSLPDVANQNRLFSYVTAALLFMVISVLFYSSFFTNFPKGVIDSVRTFEIWVRRSAQTDQYRAPWFTYLDWLRREELAILVLGSLGIVIALWRGRDRLAVFVAFWALGITVAYSMIPYKTPWLILNLLLPLAIIAGYGLAQFWQSKNQLRVWAVVALLVAVAGSLYRAVDISFFRYDDDSVAYVYAHTSRQLLDLVDEVENIASRNPAGKNTGVTIVSPEYWPLPWYFRNYPQALFWGHMVPTTEPMLIALANQADEVQKTLGKNYWSYKSYDLRPGNVLVLFLRRDVQP